MGANRAARVGRAIKEEMAGLLRSLRDPRIGFASIVDVETSADLRYAKIYVSVYGDQEAAAETIRSLDKTSGFLRGEIGRKLGLRYAPEISFHLDQTIAKGARIQELLRETVEGGERGGG